MSLPAQIVKRSALIVGVKIVAFAAVVLLVIYFAKRFLDSVPVNPLNAPSDSRKTEEQPTKEEVQKLPKLESFYRNLAGQLYDALNGAFDFYDTKGIAMDAILKLDDNELKAVNYYYAQHAGGKTWMSQDLEEEFYIDSDLKNRLLTRIQNLYNKNVTL